MLHIDQNLTERASLRACPDCDLLLRLAPIKPREEQRCPRCNARVNRYTASAWTLSFNIALAGLLLLVPAVSLPLLEFSIIGMSADNSVIGGSLRLYHDGWPLMAMLISWCAIVAPALQLALTLYLSWQLQHETVSDNFARALKALSTCVHWSMIEVYLLGVFLAWTKMIDLGHVRVLEGSWCLAAMLVCCLLSQHTFDRETAWHRWHRAGHGV